MNQSVRARAVKTSTRTSDIPKSKSPLPFIGHGLKFRKNSDQLMLELFEKHGHEFTIRLGGTEATILLNPHDFTSVLSESKVLRAEEVSHDFAKKAFNIRLEPFYKNGSTESYDQIAAKFMRPTALEEPTRRFQHFFEKKLFDAVPHNGMSNRLNDFVGRLIYEAGAEALFGDGEQDFRSVYADFQCIDRHLGLMANVPQWMLRGTKQAKDRISAIMRERPNQATVFDERYKTFREYGTFDQEIMSRADMVFFWAAHANTVPMAFYTLFFILREPAVREVIEKEVRDVMGSAQGQTEYGTPLLTMDALSQMVQLDALIDEVLRLKSAPMTWRKIKKNLDTPLERLDIPLVSGRNLVMEKETQIAMFPRFTHINPEIYENPLDFQWDRFIGKQRPYSFNYQNKSLKYHLLPFGGGVSICPGRNFARNEFKVATALILNYLNIDLHSTEIPPHDYTRIGTGTLPPLSDIGFNCQWNKDR